MRLQRAAWADGRPRRTPSSNSNRGGGRILPRQRRRKRHCPRHQAVQQPPPPRRARAFRRGKRCGIQCTAMHGATVASSSPLRGVVARVGSWSTPYGGGHSSSPAARGGLLARSVARASSRRRRRRRGCGADTLSLASRLTPRLQDDDANVPTAVGPCHAVRGGCASLHEWMTRANPYSVALRT